MSKFLKRPAEKRKTALSAQAVWPKGSHCGATHEKVEDRARTLRVHSPSQENRFSSSAWSCLIFSFGAEADKWKVDSTMILSKLGAGRRFACCKQIGVFLLSGAPESCFLREAWFVFAEISEGSSAKKTPRKRRSPEMKAQARLSCRGAWRKLQLAL